MNLHNKKVVFIYDVDTNSQQIKIGNGLLISFGQKCFVATCRHVIENIISGVIIANQQSLKLGTPHFHPSDNNNESYDVAICGLENTVTQLNERGINALDISKYVTKSDHINTQATILCYSINYLQLQLNNQSNPLLLNVINGFIENNFYNTFRPSNFKYIVKETNLIKLDSGISIEPGYSGSPLFDIHNNWLGILIGSINSFTHLNGNKISINGGAYVNANRFIETLSSIN